jgi:septal ring factor EnvC (AmiA/AmiB activator)
MKGGQAMSKDLYPASSTQSTTLGVRGLEKEQRKRRRSGFFSGLIQSAAPARADGKSSLMSVFLVLLLWSGLAYGGYLYANHTLTMQQRYFEKRMEQVQAANEQQIKQLEEQLVIVQDEMKKMQDGLSSIEEELELTGETIGGTNKTKQALQVRIDQLNKQLTELKASLKKLEDAARAW